MSNFVVTLAELRKAGACIEGYNKLVRGLQGKEYTSSDSKRETYIKFSHKEQIGIDFIAENNGIDDALWTLREVKNEDRAIRLYAVWCVRQVEHLMEDTRSIEALNVAARHASGLATDKELAAARTAAGAAARAGGWYAIGTAWAAAEGAARAAQKEMLIKMCRGEAPWQISR